MSRFLLIIFARRLSQSAWRALRGLVDSPEVRSPGQQVASQVRTRRRATVPFVSQRDRAEFASSFAFMNAQLSKVNQGSSGRAMTRARRQWASSDYRGAIPSGPRTNGAVDVSF